MSLSLADYPVKGLDYVNVVNKAFVSEDYTFKPCVVCGSETKKILNHQISVNGVVLGWEHFPICSDICENIQCLRGFI